jgi:hypothetical protein
MHDDFDVGRLAEIPDPFAGDPVAPGLGRAAPAHTASATRARVRALRALAAGLAVAFEITWLARTGFRPNLRTTPAPILALGFLVPLVGSALALRAVTRAGAHGLGEPTARVAALVFGPPLLFAAATLLVAREAEAAGGGSFWGGAFGCLTATGLLTIVPLALGALAFRRAFPSASRWRSAALGVACGAIAAATIWLACPNGSPLHVLVAHGAAMLVGGLLGASVVARVTRS